MCFSKRERGLNGSIQGDLAEISVKGIKVKNLKEGSRFDVSAEVVVDATGYGSVLRTGLKAPDAISRKYTRNELASAYRTVRKIDKSKASRDDLKDHYRYGAFKGYFWTHKHSEEVIDVGGGVKEEPGRVEPKEIVEEMIACRPSITETELRGGGGIVLVGRSPYTLAASGFLAVGDAAGQVIPTTGCGVGGAITGAVIAAETIAEAIRNGNCRIDSLWNYNWRWFGNSGRGGHFAALSALKEILQDLSHQDIAFLMKKDILSGEMLTPSINGIFEIPDIMTMIKTVFNGLARPSLLMKLNQATSTGKKIFKHYQKYPKKWNSELFDIWESESKKLFEKIIS